MKRPPLLKPCHGAMVPIVAHPAFGPVKATPAARPGITAVKAGTSVVKILQRLLSATIEKLVEVMMHGFSVAPPFIEHDAS